ncbi:24922_t:CDS:1, partial [Gigaspora margarita]
EENKKQYHHNHSTLAVLPEKKSISNALTAQNKNQERMEIYFPEFLTKPFEDTE